MNKIYTLIMVIIMLVFYFQINQQIKKRNQMIEKIAMGEEFGYSSRGSEDLKKELDAFDAYRLEVEFRDLNNENSYDFYDIKNIIIEDFTSAMGDYGIKEDRKNQEPGRMGVFDLKLRYKQQLYKGTGSNTYSQISIPYYMEADLKIVSTLGESNWDGEYSVVADAELPTQINEDVAYEQKRKFIKILVKKLIEEVKNNGEFSVQF